MQLEPPPSTVKEFNFIWHKWLNNAYEAVAGAFSYKYASVITTTYSASIETVILVNDDTAGGAVTVTLPAAAKSMDKAYYIKKLGTTGNVVIDGNGSETIDGSTTVTISTQYTSLNIYCNGTAWYIV